MKVEIDMELCQAHGVCMGEAPEVFKVSDDGKVEILQTEPPAELDKRVKAAAAYCPTLAIKLS